MNTSPPVNRIRVLLVVWMLALLYLSLYPFTFTSSAKESGIAWRGPRLDSDWVDMAANFIGYAPLGFLALAARRRQNGWALAVSTLAGAGLSLTIELAQMYLPTRDSNLRDFAFNSAGALAGGLAAAAARRSRWRISVPSLPPIACILIVLWTTWQIYPFFPVLKRYKLREWLAHAAVWDFRGVEFGDVVLAVVSVYAFSVPSVRRTTVHRQILVGLIVFLVLLSQSLVAGVVYSNARVAAATVGLVLALSMGRFGGRAMWGALATAICAWLIYGYLRMSVPPFSLSSAGIRGFAGYALLCLSATAAIYRAMRPLSSWPPS